MPPESSLKADERPDWMKRWEKTGLLKFEDKNGDGRIQYYNDKTKDAELSRPRPTPLAGRATS